MKRSLVGILSVLALALAIPVMAQSEQTASGTVVSSSATQIVVQTADGRRMTFVIDADSNAPSNLQQGSPVTVRYHDMNGTLHAANVTAGSPTGTAADRTRPAADPTGNDARTTPVAPQDATDPAGAQREPTTGTTATRAEDQDQTTGTTRMPATASPLPLMGLSGLIALAGGLGARALRRRR
jgi:hypothetical protein